MKRKRVPGEGKGKGDKKNTFIILILAGIMFFGVIAGGFMFNLFGDSGGGGGGVEQGYETATPPPAQEQKDGITLKHNPENKTVKTPYGTIKITYDNDYIYMDSNPPLANKTLNFEITLKRGTEANKSDASSAQNGDFVEVDYTGRFLNGTVFDTSYGQRPLTFIVGSKGMIKGFDEAVINMSIGETKNVTIPPEKAYGLYDPKKVQKVPISQDIPATFTIKTYVEYSPEDFKSTFGTNATVGELVVDPETMFTASVYSVSSSSIYIERKVKAGDIVQLPGFSWNQTVVSIYGNIITLKHDLKKGDVIEIPGLYWNTTVMSVM